MQSKKKINPETEMTPQRLKEYSLFLLSRQDYTAKRMREKITLKYPSKQFGDSETVINSLMESLENAGYINDERFLANQLNSLLGQKIGESKIKQRLVAKGFSPDLIRQAMTRLKDDDSSDFFSKALAFKIQKYGDAPILDRTLAQKALRTLVNKGFSFTVAQKAIKHVGDIDAE